MGKGSSRRPSNVSLKTYERHYDRIFGKKRTGLPEWLAAGYFLSLKRPNALKFILTGITG